MRNNNLNYEGTKMKSFEEYIDNCDYEQSGFGFKDEWGNYYTFEEVQSDWYDSIVSIVDNM